MRRGALAAAVLCLLALSLAACGGGSSGNTSGGGSGAPAGSTKVTLSDYKFQPADIQVKAGKAVFFLVNSGTTSHDMVVMAAGGKAVGRSELIQPGNTSVLTIDDLPAGSYNIICDQPGHADLGMKGTITAS